MHKTIFIRNIIIIIFLILLQRRSNKDNWFENHSFAACVGLMVWLQNDVMLNLNIKYYYYYAKFYIL